MQFQYGCYAISQGGDLADHVHAAVPLIVLRNGVQAGSHAIARGAVDTLARDAQAPEVHPFQRQADFERSLARVAKFAFFRFEFLGVGVGNAADRMAGAGFQKHGIAAGQRLFLEEGGNRSGLHRFMREQVGGADEHADLAFFKVSGADMAATMPAERPS